MDGWPCQVAHKLGGGSDGGAVSLSLGVSGGSHRGDRRTPMEGLATYESKALFPYNLVDALS